MSRTDVHAPAWVKERDPLWRSNHRESHNHLWQRVGSEKVVYEDGRIHWEPIWEKVERCDLDVYLAAREWVRTACRIEYVHTGRNIYCGCNMCTGKIYRKLSRKADRTQTKRLLRSGRWDDIYNVNRWRY